MSTTDQIGDFPPILAGERKTLTFQFDDELAAGETLAAPIDIEVVATRGTDPTPSAFILASGFDAGNRNVLVVVKGAVRPAAYEIRVGCGSSDPNHEPMRAGRIEVI